MPRRGSLPNAPHLARSVNHQQADETAELALHEWANAAVGALGHVFEEREQVLAHHAMEHGVPLAIVNLGPTRGDPLAAIRVTAPVGRTLESLRLALIGRSSELETTRF